MTKFVNNSLFGKNKAIENCEETVGHFFVDVKFAAYASFSWKLNGYSYGLQFGINCIALHQSKWCNFVECTISQLTTSHVGIAGNNSCFLIRQRLHLDKGVGGSRVRRGVGTLTLLIARVIASYFREYAIKHCCLSCQRSVYQRFLGPCQ